MPIIVAIDDTDNIDWEQGTGRLVSGLIEKVQKEIDFPATGVVRHQLLVHPDIPYTSHNSAMSFEARLAEGKTKWLLDFTADYLHKNRAPGSDPGFCLYRPKDKENNNLLVEFGQQAKKKVLTKKAAYRLARQVGAHLSEHGGTGDGVIGALAGAGLRLSGSDGRFRGRFEYNSLDNCFKIAELKEKALLDQVLSLDGRKVPAEDPIKLSGKVKSVFINREKVLLVVPVADGCSREEVIWQNCPMNYLRQYY